ncbi:membrane spanning protein in TonB-ExbB-ExbD complex [Candidatus Filomicrobium marinum]|uniref:Membrane spanning protein in TonB-ExbB-ExbD complex n=2 Tax=Filomicrobium TaxID=119044 RepID=A0A0D6JCW2_9HYPH|nr:membrane spanning protein in TonB-ExbB-ExbD complex [Candidatus Filomicrobium marinum]CPR17221.1 membrane spanning protein in TonB-ExbB-ExbD complex [Candidatus Filomicrobium marinum]SDO37779.1 Cell division and transport-associated protein TolQ (TC 2.C.1.2.1) [Filomicrobium insigne]
MGETSAAAHDLSIIGLVLNADIVVQSVMAGLVLASIACWAIIFEKIIRMSSVRRARRELEAAAKGEGFTGHERSRIARAIHAAAYAEATEGAAPDESQNDRRARLERAMRTAMRSELKRIEGGLPFLATIGSAAPFIGLFGTVWGIMNSFTAIAQQKDTSLAVVAPGIAEALFATALGLAAAIPAVMAYNQFAVGLGGASEKLSISIAVLAKKMARRGQRPGAREEAA